MENNVIQLYENTNPLVNAAIDKIVVEIFNKRTENNHQAQTIVLCGASPLSGTTSTAIALSIASAATGRKVVLIDCDVRKAEKYKSLNEKSDRGLADYLLQKSNGSVQSGTLSSKDIVYNTNIENLQYIPCGSFSVNATRILCSTQMTPLMNQLKAEFDYIICDLPSITIVPDAQILFPHADGIILLSALGETRKRDLHEAKRKIKPFQDKYYGMIINKVETDLYRKAEKNFDYYITDVKGEQKFSTISSHKSYTQKKKSEEQSHV